MLLVPSSLRFQPAKKPSPVFWSPWVRPKACRPSAVLKFTLTPCSRLTFPTAVFISPLVRLSSAAAPDCCIHFSTCKTIERRGTNGDISGASCVTQKRLRTNRRVAAGGGAVIKRLKAEGGVVHPGCKAKECVLTLSGVSIGIAAIRWRDNCLRCLRKHKTGQQKRNEKEDAPQRRAPDRSSYPRDYCQFKMRCCFHVFISYFS